MPGRSSQSWAGNLSCLLIGVCCCLLAQAAEDVKAGSIPAEEISADKSDAAQAVVEKLDKPLYNPFVERYVLDELKQLRTDMAAQRTELIQQVVDREIESIDRGVSYATNTVTYFFYLIAASSSVLVLVGWRSIADIKERVHSLADKEINRLVNEYEQRLHVIEKQLNQKTQNIENDLVEHREEIELTRDIQSLWLRAGQESSPLDKVQIYDQILTLNSEDCEALTYKADAVLELNEPQWAANLCHQALLLDPENAHAFYQLACAYALMERATEAVEYLEKALQRSESYREKIVDDPALASIRSSELFKTLTQ